MPKENSSEKKNLIIIFSLFFLLSASLFYLMIKKDLNRDERTVVNTATDTREENVWPRVQIEVRK